MSSGSVLSIVIGLLFLITGLYTVKSPEMSAFRGANIIDEAVGGDDPSPPERVIAKIAGYTLILLGIVWLYIIVWL